MSVDFEKIKEVIKKRDDLLLERPSLIPLQEKINEELLKVGSNKHNRMAVITSMMMNTFSKIVEVWEAPIKMKDNNEIDKN